MEKKLPNRSDIPIDIPNAKIEGKDQIPNLKELSKLSYSFSSTITDPSFFKAFNYVSETTPAWYSKVEKEDSEIAELRHKATKLLTDHYSVGKIVNEFGTRKFPRNTAIMCKCGEKVEYITDFFVHLITNHGNSLSHTVKVFDGLLTRISKIEGW